MINEIEMTILNSLQAIFDQFGWLGVAGMMTFENATGLTPSEVILGLAGWMLISAHQLPFASIFLGGLYAMIGSVAGASLAYWVARLGGRPIVDRLARWVRIDAEHVDKAEAQFQRWGNGLVFFGRMMPGVRTLVSLPAGLARMPFLKFLLWTAAGAYIWCTLLLGVGFWLGQEYHLISGLVKQYAPYLLAVGVLGMLLYFLLRRGGKSWWWSRRESVAE